VGNVGIAWLLAGDFPAIGEVPYAGTQCISFLLNGYAEQAGEDAFMRQDIY
jgi:hypothetical protein